MGDEGACGESDRKRLTPGNVFVETRVPVCVLRGPNLGLPCSRIRNRVGEICKVCVCLCVCVHIFMFVFARKCVCMHVCVCVCLCIKFTRAVTMPGAPTGTQLTLGGKDGL